MSSPNYDLLIINPPPRLIAGPGQGGLTIEGGFGRRSTIVAAVSLSLCTAERVVVVAVFSLSAQ